MTPAGRTGAPTEPTGDFFVYGTLLESGRADAVLDDWRYVGDAVLHGLHRVGGAYPTLAPGGSVDGRLLRTTDVDRLDAYEGVDAGLYVRASVPVASGGGAGAVGDAAFVYVGDPDRLDAHVTWPGDGPFADRVRRYVDANDVVVSPAP